MTLASQPSPDTTAWRIWHDARAGLWIDHFDGRWMVQTQGDTLPRRVLSMAEEAGALSVYWRPRDAQASTEPTLEWGEAIAEPFSVEENGARYCIDFSAGYSPGIFLDQRQNRLRVKESAKPGDRVLNAFAYTGAFSVAAALAGAETSTLDLSRTYLDWTWENFALNGLNRDDHHGCRGDAFQWLATFGRQGREFDGVILDPPTFSRHKKKTFRTDRDYAELAELAARVVTPGGWLLCCANTHRMGMADYRQQVVAGVQSAGRRVESIDSLPMPPEYRGDDYLKSLWLVVR